MEYLQSQLIIQQNAVFALMVQFQLTIAFPNVYVIQNYILRTMAKTNANAKLVIHQIKTKPVVYSV